MNATTGRLEHLMLLPQRSYLPLVSAALTAGAVLSMLFKVYAGAAFFAMATALSFVAWSQLNVIGRDLGPLDVGRGEAVPPHTEVARPAAWWATTFALLIDATLFASLAFGTLYLWLIAPNWPPPDIIRPGGGALLAITGFAMLGALRYALKAGVSRERPLPALIASALLYAALIGLLATLLYEVPDPRQHAHGATTFALLLYAAIHAGVGLIMMLNLIVKAMRQLISARSCLDVRIVSMWQNYIAGSGIVAIALVLLMPSLIGMLEQAP